MNTVCVSGKQTSFLDGNERTALAFGDLTEDELASWFRDHLSTI